MACKIKSVELNEIDDKLMVVVLEGHVKYRGEIYTTGQLVNRGEMQPGMISDYDPSTTKLVALNKHEYWSFLFAFVTQEMVKFKEFINGIQTFKMFTEKTIQKFS